MWIHSLLCYFFLWIFQLHQKVFKEFKELTFVSMLTCAVCDRTDSCIVIAHVRRHTYWTLPFHIPASSLIQQAQHYANHCCIHAFIDLHITVTVFYNWSTLEIFQVLKCFALIKRLSGGLKLTYAQFCGELLNSVYCNAADVKAPGWDMAVPFRFLGNVKEKRSLTGTWMWGKESRSHYIVIKTIRWLRKTDVCCCTSSWDSTHGKKNVREGSNWKFILISVIKIKLVEQINMLTLWLASFHNSV